MVCSGAHALLLRKPAAHSAAIAVEPERAEAAGGQDLVCFFGVLGRLACD